MTGHSLLRAAALMFVAAFAARGEDAAGQNSSRPDGRPNRRAEILYRLDANGDGILQPDEIPDNAKAVLKKAAKRSGLKPGEPISVDRLIQRRRREEAPAENPEKKAAVDSPKPSQSAAHKERRSTEAKPVDAPPAVRGFGEEPRYPPIPGFDVSLEIGADSVRGTSRNSADAASASARTGASSPSSGKPKKTPAAKESIAERTRKYAKGLVKKYDKNKDGVLQTNEIEGVSGSAKRADQNGDGNITVDELAATLMSESEGRGNRGKSSGNRSPPREDEAVNQTQGGQRSEGQSSEGSDRRSDRRRDRSSRDREKSAERRRRRFDELDRDRDGQVAMNEFASKWSASKVTEFERLDDNGDGFLTREEME